MIFTKKVINVLTGIILFLISALFVFLLITFIVFFLVKPSNGEITTEEVAEASKYQSLLFNPTTEETSFGSLTMLEELSTEGYESFVNNDGNHVLISPFGSDEYHCKGVCYCEGEGESNRRMSSAIPLTLNYLLAATTGLLAYQISQRYFDQQCQQEMTNECASEIKSDVLECKMATGDDETTSSAGQDTVNEQTYSKKLTKYTCNGYCHPYAKYLTSVDVQKTVSGPKSPLNEDRSVKYIVDKYIGCGDLKLDGVDIKITVSEEGKRGNLRKAKMKFLDNNLRDFCIRQSQFRSGEEYKQLEKGSNWMIGQMNTHRDPMEKSFIMHFLEQLEVFQDYKGTDAPSWCSATMLGEYDPSFKNVKCRKKK